MQSKNKDMKLGSLLRLSPFTLILAIVQISDALSRQTEAALRDFSRLRFEAKRGPSHLNNRNYFRYTTQGTSATEDAGVVFKPSYPDSSQNDQMNFISFNPSQIATAASNNHNSNAQRGNEGGRHLRDDNENDPGMGGFFPQRNPNYSQDRPLIGGPGLEEDISSVGLGISPAGYSQFSTLNPSDDFNLSNVGSRERKQELSNYPDEDEEGEDAYFVPRSPPPPDSDAEQGYGFPEGVALERGAGGLFDGDSNDADSDNDDNSYGNFEGRGHAHGDDDSTGDDHGVLGYGALRDGISGRPPVNHFDYGDY